MEQKLETTVTAQVEKQKKDSSRKKFLTKIIVALAFAAIVFPLLTAVAYSSVPGRIIGFIIYFLIISLCLYEFGKILPLPNWAKYYIPLLSALFAFYPFQDFQNWIISNDTERFAEYIKSQYLFTILGIDGLGYLFTALYLVIPFMFIRQFSWKILAMFALMFVGTIMIGITGKILYYLNGGDFWLMLILIAATIMTDSFAYFGGKFLGNKFFKRKLAPKISPNKTIEGAIVGYLVGFIIAIVSLNFYEFDHWDFQESIWNLWWFKMIIFPLTLPIVAIIGDLAFSFVKRVVDVKDFANFMPEHGGFLDRFDSIIVVTFFYLMIFLV